MFLFYTLRYLWDSYESICTWSPEIFLARENGQSDTGNFLEYLSFPDELLCVNGYRSLNEHNNNVLRYKSPCVSMNKL
jgi:hypothetical protein